MLYLVIGGAASGKSALAEQYAVSLGGPLLYIATMKPYDMESWQRISRHQSQRHAYGFDTLEQYVDLAQAHLVSGYKTALLECLGNLTANEMFADTHCREWGAVSEKIVHGVETLVRRVPHLVVVSNQVFGSSEHYEEGTCQYRNALGEVNRRVADKADIVVEAVCGLPLVLKGEDKLL